MMIMIITMMKMMIANKEIEHDDDYGVNLLQR